MIDVPVCPGHVKLCAFPADSINRTPTLSTERSLLFSHIYRTHFDFVRRLLKSFQVPSRNSEDIAHDVFFAMWRQFDKYDESRPIKSWLYVFVLFLARDYHALVYHSREVLTAYAPDALHDVPSVEDRMEMEEDRQIALQAANRLDPMLYEILMLHCAGRTAPKIAAKLGIPLDTVYTRLRRARQKARHSASRLLAERERRRQIRQAFPAAVRGRRDERPAQSEKRFDLRPRAARRVEKQGGRNQRYG